MKNICYVFAAGDYFGDFSKGDADIVIAADAGFHHLNARGISPDILLGDFDTIGNMPQHGNIKKFPCEKDYTDTELAILEGIEQGFEKFVICGALGGERLEHTVANITLCASYAEKGYDITLTDGKYIVKALHNASFEFEGTECGFVSVFTLSGTARGVTLTNLKYTLSGAVLDSSCPTLCVSNEFIGKKAKISVDNGTLIIIWKK